MTRITVKNTRGAVILVIALCSAYENVIFDENDVLRARWTDSPEQEDRVYCKGRNMYEKE